MLFFICLITIFVWFFINESIYYRIEPDFLVGNLFVSASISFIIFIIASGLGSIIFAQQDVFDEPIPIYAISNSSQTSGNFFLGCGSVDSKEKYFFIRQYKDGQKMDSIDVKDAWVVFDENVAPSITTVKNEFANKLVGKLILAPNKVEYMIVVPNGTVKYNYNIELPN
jgi:hypothetical protein